MSTRRPKAPPPCHCHLEGTGVRSGQTIDGRPDQTIAAVHCPLHKRWVPLAEPEAAS